MRSGVLLLPLLLAACLMASGCGLNTAVLQKGGNGRMGVLLNYSCGANPCDPIDPSKCTIVITHGWNPLPSKIRCTFGPAGAAAVKARYGDRYNLLSWDWNGVRVPALGDGPINVGREQGRMLAAALRSRGVDPGRTHVISHSLGTVVTAQAAACMADLGPFAQLTLLDPPESMHEEIFQRLCITHHAEIVENYWSPGVSGYGAPTGYRGVRDYKIVGAPHPVIGIVNIGHSNHVYAMRWYYETMRCSTLPCGFQSSLLLGRCECRSDSAAEAHPLALADANSPSQPLTTSAGSRRR